ncbi:hypothetical protein [Methylobacterium brachythecii]|uniref:Uncharacterized protein n=1 Tax=Methylobacterium brachythecii TaxID=1176177 RepID=A0A7W6AK59_9HYPH|nr:hypothetical protein [Methylobacterium brachythecii]
MKQAQPPIPKTSTPPRIIAARICRFSDACAEVGLAGGVIKVVAKARAWTTLGPTMASHRPFGFHAGRRTAFMRAPA